jgi:hypothetical protein
VHENIRIAGNHFDGAGIFAKNVKGLTITGNSSSSGSIPLKLADSCSETKVEKNEQKK